MARVRRLGGGRGRQAGPSRRRGGRGAGKNLAAYLVFRLLKPEITEARCRACEVMGGTVVETSEQAADYTRLFKRSIEEGDFVEEAPCIQRGLLRIYPEEHGRPCPRVELEPRNVEAMDLAGCLMRDDTRVMFPMLFERLCDFLPRGEQLEVLQRIEHALQDAEVNEALALRLNTRAPSKGKKER